MDKSDIVWLERATFRKGRWADGPWKKEPDEYWWMDGETEILCSVRRHPFGYLCGYVYLPRQHLWAGKDCEEIQAEVHGGVTWSKEGRRIKYLRHDLSNLVARSWIIGFDCGHPGDMQPALIYHGREDDTYRDFAYAVRETRSLARQAAAVADKERDDA